MGFLAALALLFAFGTWEFWLAAVILCVIVTAFVENENGTWATVVAVGTIVGLNYVSKVPVFAYLAANPFKVLALIGIYLASGAVWSIVKWYIFVHKERIKYEDYKAKFLKENNATALTPELASRLQDKLADSGRYGSSFGISSTPPSPREHKADLTRWATYWPFSILGTLLNDFVRRIWNYVYEMLQSTYQRISTSVYKGATADMAMAADFKAKAAAAGADDSVREPKRSRDQRNEFPR